jgi:anaerobic ribonucleoside-triphosphate reductase activating protein
MRYAGINYNDMCAAPGVSVTLFTQGCPHHCEGCHNPETWDFDGGKEFTPDVLRKIVDGLTHNEVKRNFCIMGGEPLCEQNTLLTLMTIQYVKQRLSEIKIYLWTGYYYEQLLKSSDPKIPLILKEIDVLIDGPFIKSLRDVTLKMRGSSNQNIIDLKERRNGSKN